MFFVHTTEELLIELEKGDCFSFICGNVLFNDGGSTFYLTPYVRLRSLTS